MSLIIARFGKNHKRKISVSSCVALCVDNKIDVLLQRIKDEDEFAGEEVKSEYTKEEKDAIFYYVGNASLGKTLVDGGS